ncbi:MAG: hypothetical protein JST78_13135 [Bacteroidetes bacterium]|nr:hypothetical protein [Bacteroidota bacterium]
MILCSDTKPENLKDTFYFFGIFSTFIISAVTLFIAFKNRKNALRENLYKEQLSFIGKLTTELYQLHADLTKINNSIEIDYSKTRLKIENVFAVIYSNTHIGSDNILIKTANTLSHANDFLKSIEDKKNDESKSDFKSYFKSYNELTNLMRNEMGVRSLSKENERLFK